MLRILNSNSRNFTHELDKLLSDLNEDDLNGQNSKQVKKKKKNKKKRKQELAEPKQADLEESKEQSQQDQYLDEAVYNPQDDPSTCAAETNESYSLSSLSEAPTPFLAEKATDVNEEEKLDRMTFEKIKAQKEFATQQQLKAEQEILALKIEMEKLRLQAL